MKLYPKYEGAIVGATMVVLMLLFALLCWLGGSGCARPKPPTPVVITHPVQIKIEREARCYLESEPKAPEEIKLNFDDENVLSRVWTHYLKHNEMVQFAHDMEIWAGSVRECINALTGEEP